MASSSSSESLRFRNDGGRTPESSHESSGTALTSLSYAATDSVSVERTSLQPVQRSVRFDIASPTFVLLASSYRRALARADGLLRRIEDANDRAQFSKAKKVARKLERVEAELDGAREAIFEHVRATRRHEAHSRMKRCEYRHRVSEVA